MSLRGIHNSPLLPIVIAFFGMAMLFLSTPHGVGLSPDSISYIEGGKYILTRSSSGWLSPHWPPAYPALLALFSFPQGDLLLAARIISILVFGSTLFLLTAVLQKSGWNALFATLFASLFIFDPDFIGINLMAWSEPVFLMFILSGLMALFAYEETGARKYLVTAGVAFGIAALTRYAGIAFVLGAALILLFRYVKKSGDESIYKRFIPSSLFLSIALSPIVLWMISKSGNANKEGVRSFVFHPISPQQWNDALVTVSNWFGGVGAGFVVAGFVVIFAVIGNRNMPKSSKRLLAYATSLLVAYLLLILISLLYFDAYIPLDNRILSPCKLMVYLIVVISMQGVTPKYRYMAVGVFFAFAMALNFVTAREIMSKSSLHGVGFAQAEMQNQPILSFIRDNHIEVDATNSPELAILYLNQSTPMLPRTFDPTTRLKSPDFEAALGKLAQPRNTVVIFSALLWRTYLPTSQQMIDAGFTRVIYQQPDGVILQHP